MFLVDFLLCVGIGLSFLLGGFPYLQRYNSVMLTIGNDDFLIVRLLDDVELISLL